MADIAVAVVHDRVKDRLLVVRRSDNSDFRGWVFPGGKRELRPYGFRTRMESVSATAKRELAEETGLNIKEKGREIYRRKHPETGVFISYVYFCITVKNELKTRCGDAAIVDCAWVPFERVGDLFSSKVSEVVLKRIKEYTCELYNVDALIDSSSTIEQPEFAFLR